MGAGSFPEKKIMYLLVTIHLLMSDVFIQILLQTFDIPARCEIHIIVNLMKSFRFDNGSEDNWTSHRLRSGLRMSATVYRP